MQIEMSRGRIPAQAFALGLLAWACAVASPDVASARSYKFRVLYSFCIEANCADGVQPEASLLMDHAGNLYGTTSHGGAGSSGTVFELTPGDKGTWTHKTLYSFCSEPNCADGSSPGSNLIIDSSGSLYGIAPDGGQNNNGVAFELKPPAPGKKKWHYDVGYAFCANGGSPCADGFRPVGGLTYAGASSGAPYDGVSPLFGATNFGGNSGNGGNGDGVLYQLRPGSKVWRQKTLQVFCSQGQCADGGEPHATLLADAQGNLFGTFNNGGPTSAHDGGIFEWDGTQDTVIYPFCSNYTDCGEVSLAPLIFDASHYLYGTTVEGGANSEGTIMFYDGAGSVLYSFCVQDNCSDGSAPQGGLVLDSSGNLFGTTSEGGAGAYGTGGVVFRYRDGETVLHNFCSKQNCADGAYPAASLILDGAGNLYGTTEEGGAAGGGTVFELSPI
jgi:uncharacterized repeat protein (TIGR03803 family)